MGGHFIKYLRVLPKIRKIRKSTKNSEIIKRFQKKQNILKLTNKLIIIKSGIIKNEFSMEEKEAINLLISKDALHQDRRTIDTRIKLINLISDNPGLHLNKIARVLDMSEQLAEYHLLYMVKNNIVIGLKDDGGHYKRFYIKDGKIGMEEKKKLAILRQKPLLKIIVLLLKFHSLKHKDILENLPIAPSTLSYQLNKLIEKGIIEVVPYGKERGYILKDTNEITWLIDKYKLNESLEDFDKPDG